MTGPRAPWGRRVAWLLVAALLAAGGAWLWRAVAARAIVNATVPAKPAAVAAGSSLDDAVMSAEQIARAWFHATDGLVALSRLYHANGFTDEALVCYNGLRRIQPRNARWPHLQASVLAGLGRLDDALPLEQRAVELAGGYIPARLRLGDILFKSNQAVRAGEAYAQVLQREPDNPYALLGLAKCALAKGDWAAAQEKLRQSIKARPGFIGGMSLLATVAEHFGNQAEADQLRAEIGRKEFSDLPDPWLDDLLQDCYDPYRLSVMATVVNMAGDPTGAVNLLERAIALAPKNSSYHRQLGLLLSNLGNAPAARSHLETAVSLVPTDVDAWLLLYQLLTKTGDTAGAGQVLANGLARCPDSSSLHLEQARRWMAAGRLNEAVIEYQEAQRLNPSDAQALIEIARVYLGLGREADALAALREALRNQPEHPLALATLAFNCISHGDEAGALQWWERVRRQPRTTPQTIDGLRQAYRQKFGRDLP